MNRAAERVDHEADDGRRLRRDRNRDAVIDAMLELFREGHLQPASDEIAARAGLSPRSVFRYFDDIDDLCRAAIRVQQDRLRPHFPVDVAPSATTMARIEALVAQRVRLFDAMGRVGEVARLRAPFQPLIAAELSQIRAYLRRQIRQLFASELTALGGSRGAAVLAAVDTLCSYESYQLLRRDQSLTRARAAAVLTESLSLLLARETT